MEEFTGKSQLYKSGIITGFHLPNYMQNWKDIAEVLSVVSRFVKIHIQMPALPLTEL